MKLNHLLAIGAIAAACDDPAAIDGAASLVDDALPPIGLDLEVSDAIVGGFMDIRVTGAAPNERVYIVRSTGGLGAGDCLRPLGFQCFGIASPAELHTQFRANNGGTAVTRMNVPNLPSLDGREVCFQAATIRGGDGSASLLSQPQCILAGYDTDGDGIIDQRDPCPTGDEFFDWDQDGVADACDVGNGVPPEYVSSVPDDPWVQQDFNGRQVISWIPNNPRAVVLSFHGTGGSSGLATAAETTRTFNTYVADGIGFAMFDSQNRGNGLYDTSSAPGNNADYGRVRDFRQALINQGVISNNTPIFFMGYSAGGKMASYMGHAASNWPVGGLILHHSGGFTTQYGVIPNQPTAFVAGRNDEAFPVPDMQDKFNDHRSRGFPGRIIIQEVGRLAPTRFAQSEDISQNRALELFRLVVDDGFFDRGGNWLRNFNNLEDTIESVVDSPGFSPDPQGRAVIRAVLVTHVFNSSSAAAELDFMNDNI